MFLNKEFLDFCAELALFPFRFYPKVELIIIMIMIPTCLSTFQF